VADLLPSGLHPGQDRDLTIVDDVTARLEGAPLGPAGAIVLRSAEGSEWWVDHADPSNFVSYEPFEPWGRGADLSDDPIVVALFGGEAALALADRWVSANALAEVDRGHRARRDDGPTSRRRTLGRPTGRALGRSSPGPVAAAVLRIDLASDPDLSPLARIAAAAEALAEIAVVPVGALLDGERRRLVRSLVEDAVMLRRDDVAALDPRLVGPLTKVLVRAVAVEAGLAERLEGLRDWLGEVDVSGHRQTQASEPAAVLRAAAAPQAEDVVHEMASFDLIAPMSEEPDPDLHIERSTPALVTVRTDRSSVRRQLGGWVSVWRTAGFVRLGIAPLMEVSDGSDGLVARVAVPPDLAEGDYQVRVEDLDRPPPGDTAPLPRIRDAVRAGRDACRRERLGERNAARRRWQECADLWFDIGDDDRAELAAHYAEWSSPSARLVPSLADVVVAVEEDGGPSDR